MYSYTYIILNTILGINVCNLMYNYINRFKYKQEITQSSISPSVIFSNYLPH